MMMNYRPIRDTRRARAVDKIGVPFLFLAALLFFHLLYPGALASLASRIAMPFWRARVSFEGAVRAARGYVSSKQTLIDENTRLAQELFRARAELLDKELITKELTELQQQFGRPETHGTRIIGVVLSRPPASPYDTVIVDVGRRAGITVGSEAVFGSALLGTVSKVYPESAVVELYSTAGEKTPVVILHGATAIPAEAEGRGGGEFLALLPKNIDISPGDVVTLPGREPRVFATVLAVGSKDTDTFQYIRFQNPVSFTNVRFLEIRTQSAAP